MLVNDTTSISEGRDDPAKRWRECGQWLATARMLRRLHAAACFYRASAAYIRDHTLAFEDLDDATDEAAYAESHQALIKCATSAADDSHTAAAIARLLSVKHTWRWWTSLLNSSRSATRTGAHITLAAGVAV
jgi:hypothetical protein